MTENYKARTTYLDHGVVDEYEQRRFSGLLGRYVWRREQRAVGAMVKAAGTASRVLDCPSGNGRWVSVLNRLEPQMIVEADVSPTMLEASRNRVGLPLVQCEGELLPFAGGSFDLVFCHALMKHLPLETQASVLSEFARVSSRHVVCAFSVEAGLPKLVRRLRKLHHSGLSRGGSPRWLNDVAASAGLRVVQSLSCTTPVGLERSVLFEKVDMARDSYPQGSATLRE